MGAADWWASLRSTRPTCARTADVRRRIHLPTEALATAIGERIRLLQFRRRRESCPAAFDFGRGRLFFGGERGVGRCFEHCFSPVAFDLIEGLAEQFFEVLGRRCVAAGEAFDLVEVETRRAEN